MTKKLTETRCAVTSLEMRGLPGEGATLSGYVAVFDAPSEVLWDWQNGRFVERIAPGAFDKTIREADIRALKNHDPNHIVGRVKAGRGNITFAPDAVGLFHTLTVPDTATARSLYEDVSAGLIDQMSFSFETIVDEWDVADKAMAKRYLREVALDDISYVVYPAYPQTSVDARGALHSYARALGCSDIEHLSEYTMRTIDTTDTTQGPGGPSLETSADTTSGPERPGDGSSSLDLYRMQLSVLERM